MSTFQEEEIMKKLIAILMASLFAVGAAYAADAKKDDKNCGARHGLPAELYLAHCRVCAGVLAGCRSGQSCGSSGLVFATAAAIDGYRSRMSWVWRTELVTHERR